MREDAWTANSDPRSSAGLETDVRRGQGQRKWECEARQRCRHEECTILREGAMVREGSSTI